MIFQICLVILETDQSHHAGGKTAIIGGKMDEGNMKASSLKDFCKNACRCSFFLGALLYQGESDHASMCNFKPYFTGLKHRQSEYLRSERLAYYPLAGF